jgi:phosphoglycolate phosphatase-like HAD superfamily hydrolase
MVRLNLFVILNQMKVENVRGLIWDLDGTLLNSSGVFEQIIADVVKESGHSMPAREFILSNYHGALPETIQKILNISSPEELDKTVTLFLAKQEHYYADDLEAHLFKDAVAVAQQAAKLGIHQLMVTNRAHEGRGTANPRFIVAATVLSEYIHEVHPSDEVEYHKPDKSSVGDWMDRYELAPHEVVVIGDQYVDAQLALNIGARAILIRRTGDIPHFDRLTHENKDDVLEVDDLSTIELVM